MTDYSQLSDFEINKRVCNVFWPDMKKSSECNNKTFPQNTATVYMDNGYGGFSRDYCNNPADAWPIIAKHGISIEFDGDQSTEPPTIWCHVQSIDRKCGADYQKNPLRTAMIVFLMMQAK